MTIRDHEGVSGHEDKPKEIEKKFLVDLSSLATSPERLAYKAERIKQGYMVIGTDGSEARLRDSSGSYSMTVKSGGGLSRDEFETWLTNEQFDTLWPSTEGRRVEKVRYSIAEHNQTIELDVYEGSLTGLATAEVEFTDLAGAASFVAPEWFGQEVTQDRLYKNQSLATNGIPSAPDPFTPLPGDWGWRS